jgi:sodium/hydrogen exchanger-like protein 6/7
MMLFWAGLRGAVGVALAAGITGDNADALRTTILVVVVLTVIVFGGTTARMLEVLGIRVGVEDEDASSDEEEGWTTKNGNLALHMGPGSRRFAGANGRTPIYEDPDEIDLHSPVDSPYGTNLTLPGSRRSSGRGPKPNPAFTRSYSTNSEDSDDGEPLPSATFPPTEYQPEENQGMIFRDGQWFTALDERYLLPLFSNSVTARRHHAKKAKKATIHGGESGGGTPRGGSAEIDREGEDYVGDIAERESENGKLKGPLPRTFR